jgi:alkanesulfonate monooxygenase SsuD/methylene tetrahydromethanopterin reductase-like flavin-dependent oxidoreductase (luciferase family)
MEILLQAWSQDRIEFSGKYFSLSGQLIGPRTVQQPKPLIVSAGASKPGRAFAGRYADYVFMPGRTPAPELKSRFGDICDVAERHGRRRSGIKLQMHASIIVRPTHKEAEEVSRWIYDTVDLEMVAEYLRGVRATISTYDDIYASMGELQMREIGAVAGSRKIHGGPDEVANEVEKLHREFGADGLALTFPLGAPTEIRYFADLVLPRLADRGMWSWARPTVAAGAW